MDLNHLLGSTHQVQEGLHGPLFSVSGNNGTVWTRRYIPLGKFANLGHSYLNDTYLVFKYTSGGSFRGDVQLTQFLFGNVIDEHTQTYGDIEWDFDDTSRQYGTNSAYTQTTTVNTTSYFSGSFVAPATATSVGRWNRDCNGTPSSSTGIPGTPGGGSCYMYVETSGWYYNTAWLRIHTWHGSNNSAAGSFKFKLTPASYFAFYEARYGVNIGTLQFYVHVRDDRYF